MAKAPSAKTKEAAKADVAKAGGDARAVENAAAIAGTAIDVTSSPPPASELVPSTDEARGAAAREGGDREAVEAAAAIGAGAGANLPQDQASATELRSTSDGIERVADAAGAAAGILGGPSAVMAAREDILGSAREAPGVGSSPASGPGALGDVVVDQSAVVRQVGEPPAIFSAEGSFGAAPELVALRPDLVASGVRLAAALAERRAGEITSARDENGNFYSTAPFDLEISSRRDGFRRGGIAHPAAPTPRRSTDFTDAQLRQILSEPMLHVRELD